MIGRINVHGSRLPADTALVCFCDHGHHRSAAPDGFPLLTSPGFRGKSEEFRRR